MLLVCPSVAEKMLWMLLSCFVLQLLHWNHFIILRYCFSSSGFRVQMSMHIILSWLAVHAVVLSPVGYLLLSCLLAYIFVASAFQALLIKLQWQDLHMENFLLICSILEEIRPLILGTTIDCCIDVLISLWSPVTGVLISSVMGGESHTKVLYCLHYHNHRHVHFRFSVSNVTLLLKTKNKINTTSSLCSCILEHEISKREIKKKRGL